jgi:tetratricopeptide (TPR) repeat protein
VLLGRLLFFCLLLTPVVQPATLTVLVVPFHNDYQDPELDWIGESISETLMTELGASGQIVLDHASRQKGYQRLGLKSSTLYTKATLVKLGQTLDAAVVCYGSYQITLPSSDAQVRDGSIKLSARLLDLRKLRDASQLSESGRLIDLSRLEEHLAWQAIHSLDPQSSVSADDLLKASKLIRLDAKESYIRGLIATDPEQKQKWYEQSAKLDPHYSKPAYELGKLAFNRQDYRQASAWFGTIPSTDPLHLEATFRKGLSCYMAGDYASAERSFRDLLQAAPLNEVLNNLAASESKQNEPSALDDFRRALDGDDLDPTYNFNLGLLLYRQAKYDEAARHFQAVVEHAPSDQQAEALLSKCQQRIPYSSSAGHAPVAERLKENFDLAAFKQLKAMLQSSK